MLSTTRHSSWETSRLEPSGAPFGIQICGKHYDDRFVLGVAKALEALFAENADLARPLPDIKALAA